MWIRVAVTVQHVNVSMLYELYTKTAASQFKEHTYSDLGIG